MQSSFSTTTTSITVWEQANNMAYFSIFFTCNFVASEIGIEWKLMWLVKIYKNNISVHCAMHSNVSTFFLLFQYFLYWFEIFQILVRSTFMLVIQFSRYHISHIFLWNLWTVLDVLSSFYFVMFKNAKLFCA